MRHPAAGVTELARVPRRNLVKVRYFDAEEIRTRDLCALSPPLYHYGRPHKIIHYVVTIIV